MKRVIVVGSGAGGAAAAEKLQGKFQVTVLEAGREFKPFSFSLSVLEKLKKTGLFFDEREIQLIFPSMRVQKTENKMVMVSGTGLGGTTTLSAGNALRMDSGLKELGIDLDDEFDELYRQIPITNDHQNKWSDATKRLFEICREMDLNPQPIPKLGDYERCTNCGRCVLGCPSGVKWDSRQFLKAAFDKGAKLVTKCKVLKVIIENGSVKGVQAQKGSNVIFYPAELVILAAGGFSTPVILQNSDIECESRLFVDPVLCVAAKQKGSLQNKEFSMPFAVQREHYILSPYFDYLSFFFNKSWRYPAPDTLTLMIKLADSSTGSVDHKSIKKTLTGIDKERLQEGVELCKEILSRYGIRKDCFFLGTINAGHPGGMLPLTREEAKTLHNSRLPGNLYVADATLFPKSLGNPPILTIMALAKKISKIIMA
ncbi:GMC family oxidoreductase N-terminal domain-containing protein [Candidatus Formimonas warabiya]|uniref:Choline dehydrogenase n=1 Tax=Formimonas warabiya TaxID=1761012 RepID=A0A3G1KM90_FORW1|nr:GMC family oxidoreductase N-terminal domain-containing protein [Candidatus Formimonas warabiya]ATW23568.1 choline dehydrogenase [Candidatus Formimonas warabiya]